MLVRMDFAPPVTQLVSGSIVCVGVESADSIRVSWFFDILVTFGAVTS